MLEDYVDGRLDVAGRDQVEQWFYASEENQRLFADWFLWQAQLRDLEQVQDLRQVFGAPPVAARVTPQKSRSGRRTWRTSTWLAVAACLAVAAFLSGSWLSGRDGDDARSGHANRRARRLAAATPPAATLSRGADCVWGDSGGDHHVGDPLQIGEQLDLREGLAQLYFESGANVVMNGPCRLRIDGPMSCRLDVGSVAAEVPHEATGFTIRGPNAEVIDLGTAFGFSVDADGGSQVHVFEGEVVSRQLDRSGQVVGESFRLVENQAVQFFPGQREKATKLAADEAQFIRTVPTLWEHDAIELLPHGADLALWLRAEHGVLADQQNRVIAWQDLTLLDNARANDAFQSQVALRPVLVRDAIGGRSALRFDGDRTFLSTPPMRTTNNQTIVVAYRNAPFATRPRYGGQLVNYNGAPSRFFGNTPGPVYPGVLQLGEDVGVAPVVRGAMAAKAYLGKQKGRDLNVGYVKSEPLGESRPIVVAYVYDMANDRSQLAVNGRIVDRGNADAPVAITSRKSIGRHGVFEDWGFCGDIAEVIIYNAALSSEDVQSLSESLMTYYSISDNDR
ncbi:MAG: hypothetical protein CMJ58_28015 [Planctomycetaceae bacterium]|nr:hypothetical protein [Planctomycetaceae bacterium]